MSMNLTGINNYNEYYTNHYFSSIFEENTEETIHTWRSRAKENEETRTPWSMLRENSKQYYSVHEKYLRARGDSQVFPLICEMADQYLESLGFPMAVPLNVEVEESINAPVYLEMRKLNGVPLLWVLLTHIPESDANIMQGTTFQAVKQNENNDEKVTTSLNNEELVTKILFGMSEAPRWIILIGLNQIALIDRKKWSEKRYLHFDLQEIFSRREESTLQALSVLLHIESLCPEDGNSLLDKLDDHSHRHSSAVSQDLKYALRESIELLGNEVLYDASHRLNRNADTDPVDASQLTVECLRYMYRMLFVFFIEARPELGYAPMKSQPYVQGYSLENLRDIADKVREETSEVGEGFFLHQTISKLFELIYKGYPENEDTLKELAGRESLHDVFVIDPLKAHIFDPDYTPMITASKLRNSVLLNIIDLMSITRATGRRNDRRGRISYGALGINQLGAVYEALLSYRGFIAEETLYEVKRERDRFDEMDVGYFVPERELDNYTEEERVRYDTGEDRGKLRKYVKGTFIYRLAGREREKSASYYTPDVLTKCLVKYALIELLENKTADEILQLTICEPAMGSAAFLNEAITQLAEAYLEAKQKELGETISSENRYQELQRVKMYIADRNVYGIDLNPVAVELAEVSLWLNSIYKGGFVPWFGMQLVNGNSLIGARKQCYRIEQLQANRSPGRWHDNAPERVVPGSKRMPKKQVYHFLMGDPGMSNYSDTVIKSLASDQMKKIKLWNRGFLGAHSDDEIQTILRLSNVIDDLWTKQVELRKNIKEQTEDALSVYGHIEEMTVSRTTIREKDLIYKRLYRSDKMKNAGPYARLKFAMDYWCSLWFWPIDKADMLPTRSEFLFDMSLILEGGIVSVTQNKTGQLSFFPTEIEQMEMDIFNLYNDLPEVDLPALCERNPRLKVSQEIAEANKFLHWELEFADLFEERGGFDLVIGNPPWIKLSWQEQATLADLNPLFSIKNLGASNSAQVRGLELRNKTSEIRYFKEYENTAGTKNYLNSLQNYYELKGLSTYLDQCFLPQAWKYGSPNGVSAFIHPENIYTSSNGGNFREILYPKLRRHFQFTNELTLFEEVHHHTDFSLNVYSNCHTDSFDSISNLFDPKTIDECYEVNHDMRVFGKKGADGKWNLSGHQSRLIRVSKAELKLFAKIFGGSSEWKKAPLPTVHTKDLVSVLQCFYNQKVSVRDIAEKIYVNGMWHETNAQSNGTIRSKVRFPENLLDAVFSSAHVGICNPIIQTTRAVYRVNSDYDKVDLTNIGSDYQIRVKYEPACTIDDFLRGSPTTPWGAKYIDYYRLFIREMVPVDGERTLCAAVYPPMCSHVNTIIGVATEDTKLLLKLLACTASLPFDFLVKILNKGHVYNSTIMLFPVLPETEVVESLKTRALLLNALTNNYEKLWAMNFAHSIVSDIWSKIDPRLPQERFSTLSSKWTWDSPLRTDYERRQALIEIDVLTAMALGMSIDQLKIIYRIQFPVLQSYETDTWYDRNGRIVFTNNRSLTNVGFSRSEWNEVKDLQSGTVTRIIIDDTMPSGPVERTIEYVAPFDRCDREQDYEIAWAFFTQKFKDK
ncbi:Eco57I restriction-modification methylase domain-containing protein [Paenibacillus sp. B-A-8]|uniref:Eco57I restriction-modification methylase domain-containing protein n=1 Tax=Paenibacillus sp. B-A-8 TaxID=3400419 RepID=UPI003B02C4AA